MGSESLSERQKETSSSRMEADRVNLNTAKNWVERDGKVYIERVQNVSTPSWHEGWYRNPSSGRSYNYGIHTDNPYEHVTLIVKGGCFFIDEEQINFPAGGPDSIDELYGGMTIEAARRECSIATVIQERCQSLLNKKANCPEPIDIIEIAGIYDGKSPVDLGHFFLEEVKRGGFRAKNILRVATRLGVDIFYPMSESASANSKTNPFGWVIGECLAKEKQGIYRYKIDGPNTRLLDLMTISQADRQKYFIEANNATDIHEAVERFSSELGEFFGLLHKSSIGYHSGSSEHCSLADITIAGSIMDIGGLSQDHSIDSQSESYLAQLLRATNVIVYLCQNILDLDSSVSRSALSTFFGRYKSLYVDKNIEHFSKDDNFPKDAQKIRTKYLDALSGDWIKIAPDLAHLSHDG